MLHTTTQRRTPDISTLSTTILIRPIFAAEELGHGKDLPSDTNQSMYARKVPQIINCPAFDTIQGRQLTLEKWFAVAATPKTGRGRNRAERASLADEVEI